MGSALFFCSSKSFIMTYRRSGSNISFGMVPGVRGYGRTRADTDEKGEEEAYEDTCSHTNATGRKWRSGAEHDAWFL